ncbi:MAG: ABC transporter permease [Bacteroidales bacterium]|nr:ABC transporter permease [Bacteroidales bacterium]
MKSSRYELMLARRLGWKPDERRKVSPAVGVAVTGVALSMIVMLLAVAIVSGFKEEVSARAFSAGDAILVSAYDDFGGKCAFDSVEVLSALDLPEDAVVVGRTSVEGILKPAESFLGVSFQSSLSVGADSLINISPTMALKLRLKPGDKIPAYFVIDNRLRTRTLTVSAIYQSGLAEHDEVVAYCSPSLPEKLLGLQPGQVQALGINGISAEEIEPLAQEVYSDLLTAYYSGRLSGAYGVQTIYESQPAFFTWLGLLDTNVVVIIVLMSAVAAFTIISSLFIIILERVKTIGLLKALGATNREVHRVFMLMAERLVIRGLLIGNVVGLGLIAMQYWTHIVPLDPASYFVEYVPVRFSFVGVLMLNAGAAVLSWLVLMLPAAVISRISPATTMRYE